MDSFYDQPRRAPMPKSLSTTTENILPNLVPDVSMLMQNKGNIPHKRNEMSYNAWKYQLRGEQPSRTPFNKENAEPAQPYSSTHQPTSSLFRKHVRFETPQPGRVVQEKMPNFNIMPTRPSLVNVNRHDSPNHRLNPIPPVKESDHFAMPRQENRNILQAKPFEKMYMANIPNRNLDLSIIEAPRHLQRSNSAPETNYHQQYYRDNALTKTNVESRHIGESPLEIKKPQPQDDEPSVKDLMKIIQQQNEQLMCLQQQVSTLLKDRCEQPQIEAPPRRTCSGPGVKNPALDPNKFAIDVMTSFEVSIRGPNRFNNRRFANSEAKITEISDNILDESKNSKPTELSLKFDAPVIVPERCPSPENSIHVDMKDFSSDEDDTTEAEADIDTSMIGWTIYNNVMDQVNFMLEKSTNNDNPRPCSNQYTGAIMKQVKEATLKHLQNVGVDLHHVDDDITISSDCAYTPNQVSFAVKQLLMKYLPDEQLAKVVNKPPSVLTNGDYPKNLIKRRPEFSMATVQYMEKYNLLNRDGLVNVAKSTQSRKPIAGDKMLDITALKQQPKLL